MANHGPSLLDEPARVDAFLADLCGPYHCERFLLVHRAAGAHFYCQLACRAMARILLPTVAEAILLFY